jgi:hypothetical protein
MGSRLVHWLPLQQRSTAPQQRSKGNGGRAA